MTDKLNGRPTSLDAETITLARDYLENSVDTVPSVVGLCRHIDRARSTVYDWASVKGSEFSDILENLKEIQELSLINNGLEGKFNSTITKLMLTKHDYSDKIDSTLGGNGTPIETITKVERVIVNATNTDS